MQIEVRANAITAILQNHAIYKPTAGDGKKPPKPLCSYLFLFWTLCNHGPPCIYATNTDSMTRCRASVLHCPLSFFFFLFCWSPRAWTNIQPWVNCCTHRIHFLPKHPITMMEGRDKYHKDQPSYPTCSVEQPLRRNEHPSSLPILS